MKITNRYGLPQPFVDAVSFDDYDKQDSDYSTTGLLKPARIVALAAKHSGELVEDASDRVWSMFGKVKHLLLERIAKLNPDRYITEKRYFMQFEGKKISGQIDLYDRETSWLYDWKESSVWKIKFNDFRDWQQQASINRYLCNQNGIEIKGATNIAFIRDWKRSAAATQKDYPEVAIQSVPMALFSEATTIELIRQRIAMHEAARVQLPLCTDEERWYDEHWAHMKKGQKRAVKKYDTEKQAQAAVDNANQGLGKPINFLEHRPGINKRCLWYCNVSQHCQQFRNLMQEAA